jgi:flavin-dependent dehydrogenase
LVVRRRDLDSALRDAAVAAGAVPLTASVRGLDGEGVLTDGPRLAAPIVIGADGALSRVAQAAGLVHPAEALWGFALRGYVERDVPRGRIDIFRAPGTAPVPGYGWAFPSSGGGTNVGVGLGLRDRRDRGKVAAGLLAAYLRLVWKEHAPELEDRRGGWLRMGLAGVTPARGNVLLVGDAAGLVNPLSGEGIAEAMLSGQAAAEAVLAGPAQAAERYRAVLAARHARFHSATGAVHAALVARPTAIGRAAELLTAPVLGRAVSGGGWLAANDLLEGARGGPSRAVAAAFAAGTLAATAASRRRRAIATRVAQPGPAIPTTDAA